MVLVSVFTSFIFFKLSPFQEAQPELLARTKPHLFDVFIAIFGGFAGIIGSSRKGGNNIIPGVAIATALMPPLCTAGYGLATNQPAFFWGASYLFLLNSAFVCISTIIVVKYLRVPLVHYVNPQKERQIRRGITLLAFVIIIPSLITISSVTIEYKHQHNIKSFVKNEMDYKKSYVLETHYKYNLDSLNTTRALYEEWFNNSKNLRSTVGLVLTGESVDSVEIQRLQEELSKHVVNTSLEIVQSSDKSYTYTKAIHELEDNSEAIAKAYNLAQKRIVEQENELVELKNKVVKLAKDTMSIKELERNICSFYPEVDKVEGGFIGSSEGQEVPAVILHWNNEKITTSQKKQKLDNISQWLKTELKKDSIVVIDY